MRAVALVASLLSAALASSAPAQTLGSDTPLFDVALPAGYAHVAAEFMELSEIESLLPLLARRSVGLALEWPSHALDETARYDFVRRANALGVQVLPWLLLPEEQGYWANSTNAAVYDESARQLLERWRRAGLAPSTLIVDMEMPLARAHRFQELSLAHDAAGVRAFLAEGIDRAQYAEATGIYRELVDHAHGQGFRVELSTVTMVLDDYDDGDDGLRQALNVPIDDIPWDVCTFQAYRTLNEYVLGETFGPTTAFHVYEYASLARAAFGARAGVVLGMTDAGEIAPDAPTYTSPSQLREDIDAARRAGIPRAQISVYNLRGIARRAPSEQWFPVSSWFSLRPKPDRPTLITRASMRVLDVGL